MIMQNIFKKLLVLTLSALLVFSFAACGKDDNSSTGSGVGPTQDYADEWGEMDAPTDEEKEETEKLWNDGFGSDSGQITDSSEDKDGGNTSTNTSSGNSSSTSSDEEGTASEGELSGSIEAVPGIF